mgnify:CR=1 FL=1
MEANKEEYFKLSEKELDSINELDKAFAKKGNYECRIKFSNFFGDEKQLNNLVFRAGIITAILSMSKNGLPMGIMISGGDNSNSFNGIKISSEKGEMLSNEEEKYFEDAINSNILKESINSLFAKLKPKQGKCIIVIGRDSRENSKKLSEILIKGLKCIDNCSFNFYDIIPSPSLYFLTYVNQVTFQKIGLKYKMVFVPKENYWAYLNNSFNKFHSYYNIVFKNMQENKINYENEMCIDFSNGVASLYKNQIMSIFNNKENNFPLKLLLINDNNNENELNINCGINTILEKKLPKNKREKCASINKCATLSSDLDSIIYYIDEGGSNDKNGIKVIKGEKIIVLYAKMLDFLINNFSKNLKNKYYEMIKMGIITSKYSNGAFISYCENNLKNYKLSITKTGISNIQKESKQFDISICYEYNGQGTIYISQDLSTKFGKLSSLIETSKDSQIIELFQLFIALFNSITSDGISNLLVIESIMKIMNLSIKDVYNFYNEMPYKIIDIKTKYNKFISNEDDSKIVEPENLQKIIDEISIKYTKCKIYVRPAGIEHCLRVYVESEMDDKCEIIEELSKCLKEEKI